MTPPSHFRRTSMAVPRDYAMLAANGFDQLNSITGVFRFLVPDEIDNFDWPVDKLESFVPFAVEPSQATLCWQVESKKVYHSLRDYYRALWFAPSFNAAVYRVVLEDLTSTIVAENEDMSLPQFATQVRQAVALFDSCWKPEWTRTIESALATPPTKNPDGSLSYIARKHARQLLANDPTFAELGEEIDHLKPDYR